MCFSPLQVYRQHISLTVWMLCLAGLALASISEVTAQQLNNRVVRETEALSPQEEQSRLKVPEGFEVQLFASEPMINKPINIAFDERGRMWLSSTVEYPYAAEKDRWEDERGSRVKDSRDAIKILEDTDGDGKADKVTDFADGLNIPTGVLPWHKPEHKDGCIAWSIPNIWYFADTTGDGKADHREVLFGPLGYEKDTHGMCSSFRLGADGWVYGTHGFNNTSHFRVRGKNLQGAKPGDPGTELELHSGNVYRFQPDGSRIEIWSWGQVNPFGLTFDRFGNLYSADCHSAPVYQLLRGAHYPSFGKPHDGLGFGPAMIEHTHGSTGICGIAYLDEGVWGGPWNDNVLIGNPVTSRVNRDKIQFHGTTPVAIEQQDFVISDDPWFRPVDLRIGPDGALYVADFYNRIIGHYEVPLDHPGRDRERGRIWRIGKKDGGMKAPPSPEPLQVNDVIASLKSDSPREQRAAAEAMHFDQRGATAGQKQIQQLQKTLAQTPEADTHLRHILRMTNRSFLQATDDFSQLKPENSDIALAVKTPNSAAFLLAAGKKKAQATWTTQQLSHMAAYGDPDTLNDLISLLKEQSRVADGVKKSLHAAAQLDAVQQGLEERSDDTSNALLLPWAQRIAGELLGHQDRQGASDWTELPLSPQANSESPWTLQKRKCEDGQEVDVLSSLRQGERRAEQRTGILRSREFAAPSSLTLWLCGHRGFPDQKAHNRNFVRLVDAKTGKEIVKAFPPRSDVCHKITWDLSSNAGQSVSLEIVDGDKGRAYAWLGVTRIEPALIDVLSYDKSGALSKALGQLASMLKVTAPVDLRDRLKKYLPPQPAPPPIPVSPEQRKQLDALIASRAQSFQADKADITKGEVLFATNCAACHQVGGKGGLVGPQLDGIGARGVQRLSEDIIDPNRNVDAHFYLTQFTLKDGSTVGGFIRSESDQVVRLIDAAGQEHRVAKSEIDKKQVSPLSLMPPTFGQVLNEKAFQDLMGYLLKQ